MSRITTRTVDRLQSRAAEIIAIAETVYGAGFRDEARELTNAAQMIANTCVSLDGKIEAQVRAMMTDPDEAHQ